MKIRVNGYARHGKDTVADLLSLHYGLIKPDASRIIARYLVTSRLPKDWYSNPDGSSMSLDQQVEAAYQDRIHHRTGWYNFVTDMGAETLAREVMNQGDIYVGERRRSSFDLTKGLFDYSVWVCSEERGLKPEPIESCDLDKSGHDYVIYNNGTEAELVDKVHAFWHWAKKQESRRG